MSIETKTWLSVLSSEAMLLKVDGVPNIIRSKLTIFKALWLLLLISALCTCVWLIVESVHEYTHYEVKTTSRMFNDDAPVFPSIMLCPAIPYNTEYAIELFLKTGEPISNQQAVNLIAMAVYVQNTTGADLTDEQKHMLFDLDSVLISCRIGTRACNASDFELIWHPSYFPCFRFNAPRILAEESGEEATQGGEEASNNLIHTDAADVVDFKLEMELYTGLQDFWTSTTFFNFKLYRGFYVYVHNASEYPLGLSPAPSFLQAGFGLDLALHRSFYSQYNAWPYAYSECRVNEHEQLLGPPLADPFLFDAVRKSGYAYSRATCISFCAQLMITRQFDCNFYQLAYRVPGFRLCSDLAYNTSVYFSTNFVVNLTMHDECQSKCPLECHQQTFETTRSYYRYPTDSDTQRIGADPRMIARFANQTDFQDLAKNILKFSVHYATGTYMLVEEEPKMSLDELIGLIGGHLHLFLGMSLLSFFELFEILIVAAGLNLERNARKQGQLDAATNAAAAADAANSEDKDNNTSNQRQQETDGVARDDSPLSSMSQRPLDAV